MTIKASGSLSINEVLAELGIAQNTNISLNDSRLRALAGGFAANANYSMSSFYGKSAVGNPTVTAPDALATRPSGVGTVTGSSTCTPAGGSGGYTYAWTYVSGDATINCSTTASQTGNFNKSSVALNSVNIAVWKITVTDSSGTRQGSVNINVELDGASA